MEEEEGEFEEMYQGGTGEEPSLVGEDLKDVLEVEEEDEEDPECRSLIWGKE